MSVSSVTPLDVTYAVRLDQVDANTLYIGEAPLGANDSEARWRISRYLTAGTVTTVMWANGDQKFDNIWNNRTSITYA